ncbi:B3/B4 domain-containing protein [Nocardioides sp. SYSU DS0663]|uniref:B3/B4 domain-containing protein n=1 Tax=Nocardioides sp. SYSU DS0663 TaxID=3416445 RepID=UPI003F4AFDC0
MSDTETLQYYLSEARVDPEVFDLRPDYRTMLVAVEGIAPQPSDDLSESLLRAAEVEAQMLLADRRVEDLPHISAWREAYRAFGAKPQRTRNSVEALTRRAVAGGLPRVNRLTDIYNAISVLHQVPIGGEDLTKYAGAPRLMRANGAEPFDTTAEGEVVIEHPAPGEVVWCDGTGVTCRRWNWRQARRTQLTPATTTALFIIDALEPMSNDQLTAATEALTGHLTALGPGVQVARRFIEAHDPAPTSPTPQERP